MTTRFEMDGAVVLLEESHALPLVSITILSKCGAAHDPSGKTGLARVTTRLLLRGADGLSATEIEEKLDLLGAEASDDTTASSTGLQVQAIARNVEALADLLSRIVGAPSLTEEELARLLREMDAEQLEQRDDDRTLAERGLRRAVFGDHAYGRVTTRESLSKIRLDDVRGFHSRFFTRKNIILSIAGDVTPDQARRLADRMLSRVPPGEPVPDPTPEPVQKVGRRLLFVDKPERTQTQIFVGSLGTSAHDADHYDLVVGDAVLGGSFTSRLMREVRSKRGWSYGASSRLDMGRKRQWFYAHTFPKSDDAAPCIALELDLLEKWAKKGITPREHAFIKKFLVRGYAFDIDTASKRVQMAEDIEAFDWPADHHTAFVAKIKASELGAVNAAIELRIKPADMAIVVVGTASEILSKVQAAIPGLASTEVISFEDV